MERHEMPWDLYREMHKAMRHALFGVTTLAGQTDARDAVGLQRLRDEWNQVAFVLAGHHEHEDRWCDPLVRQHAPWLRDELETAHERGHVMMDRLHGSAGRLIDSDFGLRQVLLRSFYLDLSTFTADCLCHLADEEERVMPALNAAMTNTELAKVSDAIRVSVPPNQMCVYMRYMVPSMNFAERLDLLGGLYVGAPRDVFEMFRKAAEASLPEAEYAALARAAGFAGEAARA